MKLSELRTYQQVIAQDMEDPEYRAAWERTRFAHDVAMKVIQFRVDHDLTQTDLARRLGMRQPHIARLEAGDHEPSLATLQRLASCLGMEFHIEVRADAVTLTA
jgi:DNA-binding XRE family transcriptional regulator